MLFQKNVIFQASLRFWYTWTTKSYFFSHIHWYGDRAGDLDHNWNGSRHFPAGVSFEIDTPIYFDNQALQ